MSKNTLFIEKGAIVKFLANLESGDKRLTSWVICSGDKYNENHIVTKKEQIGTLFSYCFDQYGQYTIASYGKTEDINENSIKKIEIIDPQLIEIICTLGGKMEDGKLSVKRGAIVHFQMMYKGEKVKLKKYRIIVKLKKNDKRGDVGRVDSGVFEYNAKHLDDGKPTEYIVSVEEPKKDNKGIIYQSIEMVVIPDKEEQKQTETPNIEENKILKYDISELPKFGKLITFFIKKDKSYVNFPENLFERDVHWEVTKDGKFMKSGIGLEFPYTFKEEGNFEIKCYISNKIGEVKKEYDIVQPKIYPQSAKWVNNDKNTNNKLYRAGYKQEFYAYVEHVGLQGERVTLKIYDDDLLQDDEIYKVENFEVKNANNICIPVILEKNEEEKIWDNEGKLYFTIESSNKGIKIQNIDKELGKHLIISKEKQIWATYFCNKDEIRDVGMLLYFKIYTTNLVGAKVEVCFLDKYLTEKPKWNHCVKSGFFKGEGEVNKNGEVFISVDTSKLKNIDKAIYIYATMAKFTYTNNDKEEILHKHFKDKLILFPTKSLSNMEENKSPVKVGKVAIEERIKNEKNKEDDAVVVLTGETTSIGKMSKHRGEYFMYKVNIYNGISYETYMKNKDVLEPTDTFELARDAWLIEDGVSRSNKRYGSRNETPAGTYWLSYKPEGYGTKKHRLKVSDDPKLDEIKGVDGIRKGIRIHSFSPHDAMGCLTTGADKKTKDGSKSLEDQFIDKIPALKKKPVRFIIEPREAIEGMKTEKVGSKENHKIKVKVTNKVFKGVEK